ncbi:serine-rich adhesin for platelets [Condylostylus longicornis]|uniref:serine-rich adhesin for platelets n=1 Tax=Condylostylus longicornis TaxID=2530218 RepID=UPI00244DBE32|nr:serine-rich adhesin for platelets [Condylostylus longicornis]
MEVVLNSHIALLVLGYLYEEKLDHVSKYFCKYSPHLEEEYQILKKGLRPVMINSDNLSTIVREHCYIKSKVNEIISTFPSNVKSAFERQTLTGKINHLLKIIKKTTGSSDEENKLKRNRSEASISSSERSTNTTQIEDLPGYYQSKRRRIEDSYMFVRNDFSEGSESEEDSFDNEINVQSAFTDKILEDKNFQSRLLENINTVLKNGPNDKNKKQNQSGIDSVQNNQCDYHLDEMIQDIMSVTEKDPSFEEFVQDVMANNYGEGIKKTSNGLLKTANKGVQMSPNSENNLVVEEIKQNSGLDKPSEQVSVNIFNAGEVASGIERNSPATKLLVLNSTDFVSANIQSLGSFTTDHLFLDINGGTQQFPILTGNDGTMYINSNSVQYDTRPPGNFVIVNPNQKNYEASQLFIGSPNIEECNNIVQGKVEGDLKENNAINQESASGDNVIMDDNTYLKDVASLDCKLLKEKKTPECNMNSLNISISKSLSTPRRKSSHVRVLNFSPLKIINKKSEFQNLLADGKPLDKNEEKSDTVLNLHQKVVGASNLIVENESSNGTDITGEHSNITVIKKPVNEDTPKRKTCALSCKRNLSHSNSEETTEKINKIPKKQINKTITGTIKAKNSKTEFKKLEKVPQSVITRQTRKTKSNQSPLKKNALETTNKVDPAEEWKQMRERSKNSNFDQFLREVHSKTPSADAHIQKRRKLRRKIGLKSKKNVEHSTENNEINEPCENVLTQNSSENKVKCGVNKKIVSSAKKIVQEKKPKNIEPKTNFLNFRIKTPIKDSSSDLSKKVNNCISKSKCEQKKCTTKNAQNSNLQDNSKGSERPINRQEKVSNCEKNIFELKKSKDTVESYENNQKREMCKEVDNDQDSSKEKERRTANIAHILDTPFKSDDISLLPPTPGIMLSSNLALNTAITPITKIPFSSFCNMKYTEIKTPAFAITPGGRFCYSTDKETPKSGIVTDYSSGGSYYKPDDSADLIKKLDRELNGKLDQRKDKFEKEDNKLSLDIEKVHTKENNQLPILEKQLEISTNVNQSPNSIIPDNVPGQFELNGVESIPEEGPKINSYNKFEEAGLPDITDESSTSSSSESSSSDSSESSSAKTSLTVNNFPQQSTQPLSLLSNIDSSEDDNWEIQSISKTKTSQGEKSELVTSSGMRFNVRRKITPKKIKRKSDQNFILKEIISKQKILNKPFSSKVEKKKIELQKKPGRGKLLNRNLKSDIKTTPPKKENKILTKISNKKQNSKIESHDLSPEKTGVNENKLDVLTALNLSAKKRDIATNDLCTKGFKDEKQNGSTSVEDNVSSDLFILRMEEESVSNDSSEVRNAALTLAKMKSKKLDIETKTKSSVTIENKNIVNENSQKPSENFSLGTEIKKTEPYLKKTDCTNVNDRIGRECTSYDFASKKCDTLKVEEKKLESQCSADHNTPADLKNLNTSETVLKPKSPTQHASKNISTLNESKLNSNSGNENISSNVTIQSNKENISIEENVVNEKATNENEYKSKTPTSNDFESESESEDAYDECEPKFSEKCDEFVKHFNYDEDMIDSSCNVPEKLDFVKSSIKITINNQIRKITCSEEFNLFHLKPNNEKERSFKPDCDKKFIKSSKLKKEDCKIKSTTENPEEPTLNENKSSTPFLGKIKITHRNKFSNIEVSRKKHSHVDKKCSPESTSSELKKVVISDNNGEAAKINQESSSKKNIRSEDINAVLSHLYGNGK